MYKRRVRRKALFLGLLMTGFFALLVYGGTGTEKKEFQEGEQLIIPEEKVQEEIQEIAEESWQLPGKDEKIRVLLVGENGTIFHKERDLDKEYPGELQYYDTENGIVIVNEVPLEEYLKYVVPSEMPSAYAAEALKAQAVCARTYAVWHMRDYAYPEYQAHVDDSTAYQVYNHVSRQPLTDEAVEETDGIIMLYQDEPVKAYYFATSFGSTTNENIWEKGNQELTPYIKSRLVTTVEQEKDLTEEEVFREYILKKHGDDVEISEPWYRWQAYVPLEQIQKNIQNWIKIRTEKSEDGVLIKSGESWKKIEEESIGTVKEVQIISRNEGGTVQEMLVTLDNGVLKIKYEYNIRLFLSIPGGEIHKNDGNISVGSNLLPSGYFVLDPVEEDSVLKGYQVYGGGLGHGAGMSQNGARILAENGMNYEEILHYFYSDIHIAKLEEKGYDDTDIIEEE